MATVVAPAHGARRWLTPGRSFALADDHEPANNATVMSFEQARDKALAVVRGSEISGSGKSESAATTR